MRTSGLCRWSGVLAAAGSACGARVGDQHGARRDVDYAGVEAGSAGVPTDVGANGSTNTAGGGTSNGDSKGLGGQGSGGQPPSTAGAAGGRTRPVEPCSYVALGPVMLDEEIQGQLAATDGTGYAVSWAVSEVLYGDYPTYSLELATLDLSGQVHKRATVFSGLVTDPEPNVEDGYWVYPAVRAFPDGFGLLWHIFFPYDAASLRFAVLDPDGAPLSEPLEVTALELGFNQPLGFVYTGKGFGALWADAPGFYYAPLGADGTRLGPDVQIAEPTLPEQTFAFGKGAHLDVFWNDYLPAASWVSVVSVDHDGTILLAQTALSDRELNVYVDSLAALDNGYVAAVRSWSLGGVLTPSYWLWLLDSNGNVAEQIETGLAVESLAAGATEIGAIVDRDDSRVFETISFEGEPQGGTIPLPQLADGAVTLFTGTSEGYGIVHACQSPNEGRQCLTRIGCMQSG